MAKAKYPVIQPDWISKTLAGILLGYFLAVGVSGVFAWIGPGGIDAPNKVQFNMWIIPFIWLPMFSLVYLFQTGWRAWLWLGTSNILVYGVLLFIKP